MSDVSQITGAGGIAASSSGPSKEVIEEFNRLMNTIRLMYGKKTPTEDDLKALEKALKALEELQIKDPSSEMGRQFQMVLTLLQAVGIKKEGSSFADFTDGFKILKDRDAAIDSEKKNELKFSTILEMASGGKATEHIDLQEKLYYDVFLNVTANYNDELKGFKNQLEVLKEIMTTLNKLQEFRNEATGTPQSPIDVETGAPVYPKVNLPPGGAQTLEGLKKELEAQIEKLEGLGVKGGAGSSIEALQKVVDDINNAVVAAKKWLIGVYGENYATDERIAVYGAMAWISDNRAKVGEAGNFQDNMNKAIGAIQSFNETQMGKLQDIKLDFEQMLKMLISLLEAINKIMIKEAQNIAR